MLSSGPRDAESTIGSMITPSAPTSPKTESHGPIYSIPIPPLCYDLHPCSETQKSRVCIPLFGCGDAYGSPEHPLHPNGSLVGCGGTYGPLSGLELGSLSGLGHFRRMLQPTVGESLPEIRLPSEVFTRRAIAKWLSCWMWRCIWGPYVQKRTRTVLVYTTESTGAVRWSGGGDDHHHRASSGAGRTS